MCILRAGCQKRRRAAKTTTLASGERQPLHRKRWLRSKFFCFHRPSVLTSLEKRGQLFLLFIRILANTIVAAPHLQLERRALRGGLQLSAGDAVWRMAVDCWRQPVDARSFAVGVPFDACCDNRTHEPMRGDGPSSAVIAGASAGCYPRRRRAGTVGAGAARRRSSLPHRAPAVVEAATGSSGAAGWAFPTAPRDVAGAIDQQLTAAAAVWQYCAARLRWRCGQVNLQAYRHRPFTRVSSGARVLSISTPASALVRANWVRRSIFSGGVDLNSSLDEVGDTGHPAEDRHRDLGSAR